MSPNTKVLVLAHNYSLLLHKVVKVRTRRLKLRCNIEYVNIIKLEYFYLIVLNVRFYLSRRDKIPYDKCSICSDDSSFTMKFSALSAGTNVTPRGDFIVGDFILGERQGDTFGNAISLSADGNRLPISAVNYVCEL